MCPVVQNSLETYIAGFASVPICLKCVGEFAQEQLVHLHENMNLLLLAGSLSASFICCPGTHSQTTEVLERFASVSCCPQLTHDKVPVTTKAAVFFCAVLQQSTRVLRLLDRSDSKHCSVCLISEYVASI